MAPVLRSERGTGRCLCFRPLYAPLSGYALHQAGKTTAGLYATFLT